MTILVSLGACGGNSPGGPDAAGPPDGPGSPDAGPPDAAPDAAPPAFDMFGRIGNTYRFEFAPDQFELMDAQIYEQWYWDQDAYSPVGAHVPSDMVRPPSGLYADDLIVTNPDGEQRAFGQVETRIVGQSSLRNWANLPNIRVDADEFQVGHEVLGSENFRFNNGQVGSIFREAIAMDVWRALGYAVPRHQFAWVEVPLAWGEGTKVPYTVVEVYKPDWCDRELGGCKNMWEGYYNPWESWFRDDPSFCQQDTCDGTTLAALEQVIIDTPMGPGFAAATADYIDWNAFHYFQCLSWLTDTGDDYLHNYNNVMVVERDDGKLQFFPYSIDISTEHRWWYGTSLVGLSTLAQGCQLDPTCWDDTVAVCDALLDEVDTEDIPGTVVRPVIEALTDAGMLRENDTFEAGFIQTWWDGRSQQLRDSDQLISRPCDDAGDCAGDPNGHTACSTLYTDTIYGQRASYAQVCLPP